jgi:hypothetical protein
LHKNTIVTKLSAESKNKKMWKNEN